jgi:hypothetical protein
LISLQLNKKNIWQAGKRELNLFHLFSEQIARLILVYDEDA